MCEKGKTKGLCVSFIRNNYSAMFLILLQVSGGVFLYLKNPDNLIATMMFFFATIFTLILILNLVAHVKTYGTTDKEEQEQNREG